MADEKAAKLAQARQQIELEVAAEAASRAQINSAAQADSGTNSTAQAESREPSAEERAASSQGVLLSDVKGFMRIAREGIKQRQTALQYARSTWQVSLLNPPANRVRV